VPANPLIAESPYLARYIEKAGSGTQRLIELCHEAGLPAPDFELRQGCFVLTLWRDWLTDDVLAGFDLSQRQREAVLAAKSRGRHLVPDYREMFGISKPTASRDLLTESGSIFVQIGDENVHRVRAVME
jgi:predicted HTH transcriptional regulator